MRHRIVYPGHPVLDHYADDIDAAAIPTEAGWLAVESSPLPGAGGHNTIALELVLSVRRRDVSVDEAFRRADDFWYRCDGQGQWNRKRWDEGQHEADDLKPVLRARLDAVVTTHAT